MFNQRGVTNKYNTTRFRIFEKLVEIWHFLNRNKKKTWSFQPRLTCLFGLFSKLRLSRYKNIHYKDTMVMKLFYLYDANSYKANTTYLYPCDIILHGNISRHFFSSKTWLKVVCDPAKFHVIPLQQSHVPHYSLLLPENKWPLIFFDFH